MHAHIQILVYTQNVSGKIHEKSVTFVIWGRQPDQWEEKGVRDTHFSLFLSLVCVCVCVCVCFFNEANIRIWSIHFFFVF